MNKINYKGKEYLLKKTPKNQPDCYDCIIPYSSGTMCPIPFGNYAYEVVQTLPNEMEKTIWQIMNCYHVACRYAPILNGNLNLIENSVSNLINHGCYNVAIYSFNIFKTTIFYQELKKRKLI